MTGRSGERRSDVEDRYRHVRHHPVFGGERVAGEAETGAAPAGRGGRRAGSGPRPVRPSGGAAPARPAQPERPGGVRSPQAAGSWRGAAPVAAGEGSAPVRVLHRGAERWCGPGAAGAGAAAPAGDLAEPVRWRAARLPGRLWRMPAGAPAVRGRRAAARRPTAGRLAVRRAAAGVVLVLVVGVAAALAVTALGLLADAVSGARTPAAPPAPAAVTVVVDAPGTVWDVAGRVAPHADAGERAALAGRIVTANALPSADVTPGEVLRVPLG